jgi:hypothetical protein
MSDDLRRGGDPGRLDRIENKLDALAEYLHNVARLDERVLFLENHCKEVLLRLQSVEKQSNDNFLKISGFIKLLWIVVSAVVGSVVVYFLGAK